MLKALRRQYIPESLPFLRREPVAPAHVDDILAEFANTAQRLDESVEFANAVAASKRREAAVLLEDAAVHESTARRGSQAAGRIRKLIGE